MRYLKKKKSKSANFTILCDDRERKPWSFLSERWKMETKRLRVGDYTIKGFENKIALEKKSGLAELFMNLSASKRPAFERFLKRLSKFPVKCIVVEQPLTNGAVYSTLNILRKKSNGKIKLIPDSIFYLTSKVAIEYNISLIFTDKTSVKSIVPQLFEDGYKRVQLL